MNYQAAKDYILQRLRTQLSPSLSYHGIHHTMDVLQTALDLAAAEGITDREQLLLLQTAACFHDAGFLTTYQGHEENGCSLVRDVLPGYGYLPEQIDIICGMIMATQIPQSPKTHLEQILCDADLDYLGRDDFAPIADSLFQELRARERIADLPTWNRTQVRFLENHQYWTPTEIARRQAGKEQQLARLRAVVQAETDLPA